MNDLSYVPLSAAHDAPLGALDLFEIYTLSIITLGLYKLGDRANDALQIGCPKRSESLRCHGRVANFLAVTVGYLLIFLPSLNWR